MYYISILGGMGQDPFLVFFRNRVTSREFGMKGDKGLLWEGCKTCFFPPTKFCLIIMMHDQLWFNSYMWRKEQDTQTNQQTHTHTSSSMHEMCLLPQYIEKFLKYSFILAKCFMIVEIFTLVSLAIVISRIIWFMISRQLSESLWEIKNVW